MSVKLTTEERQPCEIWSRCMGYHRPVSYWNIGKQSEHRERLMFVEAKARLLAKPGVAAG